MNDQEKKGYESFMDRWIAYGYIPMISDCPARYMKPGQQKTDFLRGWKKAREEATE